MILAAKGIETSTTHRDQFTGEFFYRFQLTQFLAVRHVDQFTGNPALNPAKDFLALFGIWLQTSFSRYLIPFQRPSLARVGPSNYAPGTTRGGGIVLGRESRLQQVASARRPTHERDFCYCIWRETPVTVVR